MKFGFLHSDRRESFLQVNTNILFVFGGQT